MFDNGISITIFIVSGALILSTLFFMFQLVKEICTKERRFKTNGIKDVGAVFLSLTLIAGISYCLYRAPYALYSGTTWRMIYEFGPSTLIKAVQCLAVVIPLFYIYYLLTHFFAKEKDKPYFLIIILSIVSAMGNSLIIFIINQALNMIIGGESRSIGIDSGLYMYYLLGIALFTMCAMLVRKRLIAITNQVVYDKRVQIIEQLLNTPYDSFENIENGKIHAALNNDTETISGFVNALVNGLTGVITLVTCFIYLGTIDLIGMVFSVLVIGIGIGLFLYISSIAEKKFEQNRDVQNQFFKFINDMVDGFKELCINRIKRSEFSKDMEESCKKYRDTRIDGENLFVGVSVLGEILYIFVVGLVVFLFPILFPSIQNNTLRSYVLIYLYMGGIVNQEIYLVPGLMRVMVSWRRIIQFINEVTVEKSTSSPVGHVYEENIEIKVSNVKYQYKNDSGEQFSVGPISIDFQSGEIVFISGGNGSGKSTLAKLISGLYKPDEGEIALNGKKIEPEELGSYYTAIFSDFYLFDKMYGIEYKKKYDEIKKYLKILRIEDKVSIRDGFFSSVKLSTGQRKRLALLVSYLENKPIFLFDEWAADQDPEYRQFFYKVLLPELKARGKIVIAITHDDRYFKDADKHIKMETGQIVSLDIYSNEQKILA